MLGKVITVMNMKGGVGKTTVSANLGGMIASHNFPGHENVKRILLIDYDPQFNLSQAFIVAKDYFAIEKLNKTTLSILTDDDSNLNPFELQVPGNHTPPKVADIATRVASYGKGEYLDIIPSTLDLMYVALGQSALLMKPMEERFEKFITECREEYDLIIIDCHPAGSIFTKTSLRNSDHVLIPVVPEKYAVRGIGLMLKFIQSKNVGGIDPVAHILFNKTSRAGISQEEKFIRASSSYAKFCMQKTLKGFKAFAELEGGTGFVWNSKKPYSKEAFQNISTVITELLERIFK